MVRYAFMSYLFVCYAHRQQQEAPKIGHQNKLDQLDNRTQVLWGSGAVHCLANGTDDGLVERPGWVEENDKFIQPSLTCILRWLPVFPK
jgi:hypothetical protein